MIFSGVCLKSSYLPFFKAGNKIFKKVLPAQLYNSNPNSSDSLCKGKNVLKGD